MVTEAQLKNRKRHREMYYANKEYYILKGLRWKKENPWWVSYSGARQRCKNLNSPDYKSYGAKGIKFKLTPEEVKNLWVRDGASNMDWPTLDRKNTKGNYVFSNCRFLEMRDNAKRGGILRAKLGERDKLGRFKKGGRQ